MQFSPALDASGRIVPGALLALCHAGTNTPAPMWHDRNGSTRHGPRVRADASGRFPPIYAEAGEYKVDVMRSDEGLTPASKPASLPGYPADDLSFGTMILDSSGEPAAGDPVLMQRVAALEEKLASFDSLEEFDEQPGG